MIQRLRRLPWLAALLLVASPAIGGQLMPVLHPCAVAASGHDHGAQPAHGGDHGAPADAGDHSGEGCTCIGSCHVPALVTGPTSAAAVSAVEIARAIAPIRAPRATPRVVQPLDLLPPTTAPPLA